LDEKLDSVELRQLKQRIALRAQLLPLNLEETQGYIMRRLQLAGANAHAGGLFPAETLRVVYRHSRGIPRLINTVCENALINAYAHQQRSVSPEIIEEVAIDLRLNVQTLPPEPRPAGNDHADVWQAVKTLLQLHEQLQGSRTQETDPPLTTVTGSKLA